jgi:DNA-binding IclR family transcriptional regulator
VEQEFQVSPSRGPGTTAVDRAADLLLRVLESEAPVALGVVAAAAGVPKSTASRLLSALERRGLVGQDGQRGRLRPGPAILRVAERTMLRRSLTEVAQPSLVQLSEASGETINLALPGHDGVEHVSQVDGRYFLATGQWLGQTVDYHCTATGKVLLAFECAPFPSESLMRYAPSTITDPAALREELAAVRRKGFAVAVDELEPGLAAMAAPVRGAGETVIASLSISGPTLRMTPKRIRELEPVLISEAQALSRRLGPHEQGERAA